MRCENCSSAMDAKMAFCPICGAPAPKKPNKKKNGRFFVGALCGVLTAVLVAGCLASTGILKVGQEAKHFEGKGYDSAEDAAMAYLEAFQKGDVDGMLSACAIESVVKNFDFSEAYHSGISYDMLSVPQAYAPYLPAAADFGQYSSAIGIAGKLTERIVETYIALAQPGDEWEIQDYEIQDYNRHLFSLNSTENYNLEAFVDSVSDGKVLGTIRGMKIGDAVDLDPDLSNTSLTEQQYQNMFRNEAERYGAEAFTPVFVEVELDGRDLLFTADAICYDGSWYLVHISSSFYASYIKGKNVGGFIEQ